MSTEEDFNDTFANFSLPIATCEKCLGLSDCTCVDDPDQFRNQQNPDLLHILATHFICIIFGAVGNLITLFTMGTADHRNKTGTNIFLISLSVSYTPHKYFAPFVCFLKVYRRTVSFCYVSKRKSRSQNKRSVYDLQMFQFFLRRLQTCYWSSSRVRSKLCTTCPTHSQTVYPAKFQSTLEFYLAWLRS